MNKKLYVGNISYQTTDEDLQKHFSEAGTVESAVVIRDRNTQRSKGFGFVEMATEEEADAAIESLNGKPLDGRELRIDRARPMQQR